MLYLIEILHQTTTFTRNVLRISQLYLIEILHQTTTFLRRPVKSSSLYLIEILHQTTTSLLVILPLSRCILSKFYIKPQHSSQPGHWPSGCILSKFYIKPQQRTPSVEISASCILSKFYIKPQLSRHRGLTQAVVSYRNSTSNHNTYVRRNYFERVVSYRNSTSNHNLYPVRIDFIKLYLIEILHQTTTRASEWTRRTRCILSKFYIKPQPSLAIFGVRPSCILSKFYIKPQRNGSQFYLGTVVSYRNSTSNHNVGPHIDW